MKNYKKLEIKIICLIGIIVILLSILTHQYRMLNFIKVDFGNTIMLTTWELNDTLQYIKKAIKTELPLDDELRILQQSIINSKNISEIHYNIDISKTFEKMDNALVTYFKGNIHKDELFRMLNEYIKEIENKIEYNGDPLYYYNLNYKQILKSRM